MNNVILIGRLTRDPEYTAGAKTGMTRFTLAVDRPWQKDKEREADFIRIKVFGREAENCDRYLSKGRMVAVRGRIQTGSYQNKEGQTVYTTDVIGDRVEFMPEGRKSDPAPAPRQEPPQTVADAFAETGEDIPF